MDVKITEIGLFLRRLVVLIRHGNCRKRYA
jgi:hypothetical protein